MSGERGRPPGEHPRGRRIRNAGASAHREAHHAHRTHEEHVMSGTTSHGHTPAAWTGSIIVFVGFCIAGAFMVMDSPVGFWVGVAVTLLGAVVGGIMRMAGLGQEKKQQPRAATSQS
jgi:hypothetical protein